MEQYLVPYLMSSHPGSGLEEAVILAEHIRDLGYMPEQVQDFYPTPSTISTCMYYTGVDPRTMEAVYVPKNPHEKAMQRALIQYKRPENYHLVKEALLKAGRQDLIGFGKECLIPPRPIKLQKSSGKGNKEIEKNQRKNYAGSNDKGRRTTSKGKLQKGNKEHDGKQSTNLNRKNKPLRNVRKKKK